MDRHARPFDPETAALIRRKARKLCRRTGFNRSDTDDVEQEFRVHLWRKMPCYDPTRGTWPSFVKCVLDRRGVSLQRERLAEKRGGTRPALSLSEEVTGADGRCAELHECVPCRERGTADLMIDLQRVRGSLGSPKARAAMKHLSNGGTTNSMCGAIGVSRRTAMRLTNALRERMVELGIEEYVRERAT